jgi:addiction module HigA family antidote
MREITRKPIHPGEILREEFMPDYGLTVSELANMIGVTRQTLNELIKERRALSPDMAVRLSACFGNSAEQWLNMQKAVDLWNARHKLRSQLKSVKRIAAAL